MGGIGINTDLTITGDITVNENISVQGTAHICGALTLGTECSILTSYLQDSAISTNKIESAAVTKNKLSFTPILYSGLTTITVATAAPGAPNTGDLWVDTS